MRVLLDETLPRRLKAELTEHEVGTVPEAGWAGTKNGELMRLAEPSFEVFITMGRRLRAPVLAPQKGQSRGSATLEMTIPGADCSCLGADPCLDQSFPVTVTRP